MNSPYITKPDIQADNSRLCIELYFSGTDHFARMGAIGKRVAEANGVMHTHPLGF